MSQIVIPELESLRLLEDILMDPESTDQELLTARDKRDIIFFRLRQECTVNKKLAKKKK